MAAVVTRAAIPAAVLVVSGLRIFTDLAIPGWASTLVAIFSMGGVQLICVGLLGEDGHAEATASLDRGRNDGPLFSRWMTRFILNHLENRDGDDGRA